MSLPSAPALLDTAVPMNAAGTPHPFRDACQWVMTEIDRRDSLRHLKASCSGYLL